jgi:hypothetical protein
VTRECVSGINYCCLEILSVHVVCHSIWLGLRTPEWCYFDGKKWNHSADRKWTIVNCRLMLQCMPAAEYFKFFMWNSFNNLITEYWSYFALCYLILVWTKWIHMMFSNCTCIFGTDSRYWNRELDDMLFFHIKYPFTHELRYLIDRNEITLGISVQGAIHTWTVSVEGCLMCCLILSFTNHADSCYIFCLLNSS